MQIGKKKETATFKYMYLVFFKGARNIALFVLTMICNSPKQKLPPPPLHWSRSDVYEFSLEANHLQAVSYNIVVPVRDLYFRRDFRYSSIGNVYK